jgi:hypothetical protein
MTAITRNPTNPNFLHPNKFQLNFARAPNIQYFCQAVNLPGISLSEVPRNTPFVDIYSPGEKTVYDVLNVTFLVDEELRTWFEIHDWIRALTFPTKFEEYQRLGQLSPVTTQNFPQFSDAYMTILSSSNIPYYRIKFIDCFPTTLSSIIFSSADTPESTITADATFRFSYFDIDKLY